MNTKLKLIEGTFLIDDANDILMNIFFKKINYHEMKNFSSQERFGKDDLMSKKRIPELKEEINKINEILSKAKLENKKVIISSEINITLSND